MSAFPEPVRLLRPDGHGPFVLTCEHAGNELGEAVEATVGPLTRALVDDHWGWDIGVARLVEQMSQALDAPAVLSRYSRLLIDVNRSLNEPDLIVAETSSGTVDFNRGLDEGARRGRIEALWEPYHLEADRLAARCAAARPVHLVSMHSFTPIFDGAPRPMEIGVLYDEHEDWARELAKALDEEGFQTALNQPYTGKSGLIYSVARHGRAHGLPFLELEVRNDLLKTDDAVSDVSTRLCRALRVFAPPSSSPQGGRG